MGAADYTICYFDKRLKNTHAHQLAASLIFTVLYKLSSGMTALILSRAEIEWFENLQTVFDDTKVLEGARVGHITMARRIKRVMSGL